eukprot:2901559-Rhodomonas_salina.2
MQQCRQGSKEEKHSPTEVGRQLVLVRAPARALSASAIPRRLPPSGSPMCAIEQNSRWKEAYRHIVPLRLYSSCGQRPFAHHVVSMTKTKPSSHQRTATLSSFQPGPRDCTKAVRVQGKQGRHMGGRLTSQRVHRGSCLRRHTPSCQRSPSSMSPSSATSPDTIRCCGRREGSVSLYDLLRVL